MRMVGEEFKLGESIHIFKATVCSFVCVCVCIYIYIFFFFGAPYSWLRLEGIRLQLLGMHTSILRDFCHTVQQ